MSRELLEQGNKRYLENPTAVVANDENALRTELSTGQAPHTMILSCADSRVPVERIFDAKPGDLFVVRAAGNVTEASQIASLEYSTAVLGSKTLLVLGHTACGAVTASYDYVSTGNPMPSKHLDTLCELIAPAVKKCIDGGSKAKEEVIASSIEENVRYQINRLKEMSEILRTKADSGELTFVGGVYDLATGKVNFI